MSGIQTQLCYSTAPCHGAPALHPRSKSRRLEGGKKRHALPLNMPGSSRPHSSNVPWLSVKQGVQPSQTCWWESNDDRSRSGLLSPGHLLPLCPWTSYLTSYLSLRFFFYAKPWGYWDEYGYNAWHIVGAILLSKVSRVWMHVTETQSKRGFDTLQVDLPLPLKNRCRMFRDGMEMWDPYAFVFPLCYPLNEVLFFHGLRWSSGLTFTF